MSNVSSHSEPVSVLTLRVEGRDTPDWPVVRILVNGEDLFEQAAPGWGGFDPDDILGPTSPLLAPQGVGRRVAVYRCSCGEAGCGVIAPIITRSPHSPCVRWTDFRNYAGVFFHPLPAVGEDAEADNIGRPWGLPDLSFDLGLYTDEIERASQDRSWETPRRQTARLLEQRLCRMDLVLPTGLPLHRVMPAWEDDGYVVRFQRAYADGTIDQADIPLPGVREGPHSAAALLAARLRAVPVENWRATFAKASAPRRASPRQTEE